MTRLLLLLLLLPPGLLAELWEKDVGTEIEIGPSATGWSQVSLSCRSDLLRVRVEFPAAFKGVLYTRGNYGEESPCMRDPEGETEVEMTLPNTVCNVIQDEESRNTTLVVQHDDFLIFEGDTAFQLGCRVSGDRYAASIDIASPDPGARPLPPGRRSTVTSDTGHVTFRPDQVRPESLTASRRPEQLEITADQLKSELRDKSERQEPDSEPPRSRGSVERVEL